MSISTTIPKIDAPAKVTGQALYAGDITPENLLHARVLFSGQPHARMLSMDLSEAEKVPGVVAIFTAKDVPVNEYGLTIFDQPVLVGLGSSKPYCDLSLWEGDQVAMIVAESEDAAAAAQHKIKIEWEPLPVVDNVFEAMRDAQILHPRHGTNFRQKYHIRKGDIEAGFAAADVIIEGHYHLPMQEHAYLQPEAGLGYIDNEGRVTVVVGGQWVHEDQMQIAHALDLPDERVRVIYPAIGGAFGGREDMSVQIVLGLAAMRLHQQGINRPIRIIWSREESILGHHKRHQGNIHARWGATRDGKITAIKTELVLDAGAYNYTSNKVLGNAHMSVCGPYEVPNAWVDSYAVYTNNTPGGAFRGFGSPQGAFVAENQMNKLAQALGLDPVEIRRRNVLREGSESIVQSAMPPGVSMPEVIEACAAAANWQSELSAVTGPPSQPFNSIKTLKTNPAMLRRGRGFACAFKNVGFSFGFPERCEATIELRGAADIEQVTLYHAGADVGQGSHTVFKQMTAEAIGVPVDCVKLVASDTATAGDSGSVSASRMTWMAGNAIRGAAALALEAWHNEERPARGHLRFTPPATTALNPVTGQSDFPNFTYGYVAEAVEVTVDIETGHIHVDRVVCADDVGKAINPQLVIGQIEGAVVQAHGYSITEHLQTKNGHILNPRLSTYLMPGIMDIPTQVESVLVEHPDPLGPWGARGMAEMPLIPYAPAVTAAIHDATGVWFEEIPLTPARVIAKLREHGLGH
ncbi:MAG: xanthine dehydrogenase family protein [Chloroflexi bacterium]|nr:xanthine dehydrogenase family protein [Chloroflexota bacterium]MBP8055634.1 xanthine dehydrogenase family protein [Chloroflexota bacterium]